MKKFAIFILMLVLHCTGVSGQNVSVRDFYLVEADNTADVPGTCVTDLNGDKCALIRVQTSQTGFAWDFGQLQAVRIEQKVGEIWIYVPFGVKKVTIRHPQFGTMTYNFPVKVEKARTYVMQLVGASGHFVYDPDATQQWLVFEVSPAEAAVELEGELVEVKDGIAKKFVNFGTYHYKVSCARYESVEGDVTVNDPDNSTTVALTLVPTFGYFSIPSTSVLKDAVVYIDDRQVGTVPIDKAKVRAGSHTVKVLQTKYQTCSDTFEIAPGQDITYSPKMVPAFKVFTLSGDSGATVKANGELLGTLPWTGELEYGAYSFEISKASHVTAYRSETLSSGSRTAISFPALTPIYGGLNIDSSNGKVSVLIDGEKAGTTPLYKSKILIGEHTVTLSKEGYKTKNLTVNVKEGEITSVNEALSLSPAPTGTSGTRTQPVPGGQSSSYQSSSDSRTAPSTRRSGSSFLSSDKPDNLLGLCLIPLTSAGENYGNGVEALAVGANWKRYFGGTAGCSVGLDFLYAATFEDSSNSVGVANLSVPLDFVVRLNVLRFNAGVFGGVNLAAGGKNSSGTYDLLKNGVFNVGVAGMQLGGGFAFGGFYLGYNYIRSFTNLYKDFDSRFSGHCISIALVF
ncbi:MAG: PEGA domain-containing protein [Bacteroidales bacterium]|nr:PEGA domain-containing protein [Bacteroidales bacterium]